MPENLIALLGAEPSPKDVRDYDITSLLTPEQQAVVLPKTYWTRPVPPRIDQEGGTCTAASSTLMRYQAQKNDLGVWVPLSYKWLYAKQKEIDGIDSEGSTLRASMQILRWRGQALTTPGGGNPAKNKITSYYAIPRAVEDLKRALYQYGVIVVAGPWAQEWMRTDDSGILAPPKNQVGGHAIAIVGYDDNRRAFGFQQTWPLPWGYKGRGIGFLRYDYVVDRKWGLWEAWRTIDAKG